MPEFWAIEIFSFLSLRPPRHPSYRADIDGLRAIAVLSVVVFHAFPGYLQGGFIGVDIFFVISGFLISGVVVEALSQNNFSFLEFYRRRVWRIFPALLLVLAASLVLGWLVLLANEYAQLGKHVAGGAGFVSNLLFWAEVGYFDNAADTKPLLHLWSLGVEEQFYIVWPVALWLAWTKKFKLLGVTLVVVVMSFMLNIVTVQLDRAASFYSPLIRFWELALGSALALLTRQGKSFPARHARAATNFLSMVGAGLIAAGLVLINRQSQFPGWWALFPVAGTLLLIAAGHQSWLNRFVLSNRLVVWVGLISYPLYLWHWPLLSFARVIESDTLSREIRMAAVLLSFLLAWLTVKFVEHPIRFRRHPRPGVVTAVLVALMAATGLAGLGIYGAGGLEFRHPLQEQSWTKWPDKLGHHEECIAMMGRLGRSVGYCSIKDVDRNPDIVIVGDSHGNQLFPGVERALDGTADNVLNLGAGPCLPFFNVAFIETGFPDKCHEYIDPALQFVIDTDAVKTVLLASRGPLYLSGRGYHHDRGGEEGFDRSLVLTTMPQLKDHREIFRIAMTNTIERLLQKNKRVIFYLDGPELDFDPKSCVDMRPVRLTSREVKSPCAVPRKEFEDRNAEYRSQVFSVLKDFPEVQVFDAAKTLCDEKFCWAVLGGKMLYRDDDHLSVDGSELLAKGLTPLLRGATAKP